jgi:hypothetical protein
LWQAISVLKIYPHFISFANEIVGGPDKVYLYTVNSNLDWGQDLKRLKKWVRENNIEKIYLDYFGGGNPKYYLGRKYEKWSADIEEKEFKRGNYLAVSITSLQVNQEKYAWLKKFEPKTKIGYSIFVFYIH